MSVSKKIVLIGHFGVGKSSLLRRFVENTFSDNYTVTIGVHIMKKEVRLNERNVTFILWDVEGTDDFTKYRPSYLLGAAGFVYVFDASRAVTYSDIKYNLEHLSEKYPGAVVQVIGNKIDLIDRGELEEDLKRQGIKHAFLSSAKTGENVDELFKNLAEKLVEHE